MLAGTPDEAAAKTFAHQVQDVSLFLDQLGIVPPAPPRQTLRIAYHDACHLSHAQGVRAAPRALLRRIPNTEIIEVLDGDVCCGSAGTYNLDQPILAASLGHKKAQNIAATQATWLAAGNIGCLTQITTHLRQLAPEMRVVHTMELLEMAYAQAL
jgi:glycolate oxidase iron-sulfur subunit